MVCRAIGTGQHLTPSHCNMWWNIQKWVTTGPRTAYRSNWASYPYHVIFLIHGSWVKYVMLCHVLLVTFYFEHKIKKSICIYSYLSVSHRCPAAGRMQPSANTIGMEYSRDVTNIQHVCSSYVDCRYATHPEWTIGDQRHRVAVIWRQQGTTAAIRYSMYSPRVNDRWPVAPCGGHLTSAGDYSVASLGHTHTAGWSAVAAGTLCCTPVDIKHRHTHTNTQTLRSSESTWNPHPANTEHTEAQSLIRRCRDSIQSWGTAKNVLRFNNYVTTFVFLIIRCSYRIKGLYGRLEHFPTGMKPFFRHKRHELDGWAGFTMNMYYRSDCGSSDQ